MITPLPPHSPADATEIATAKSSSPPPPQFQWKDVVWLNVIVMTLWHVGAVYAAVFVMPQASLAANFVLWICLWFWSAVGVTAGSHRLWAHKSYKAKLPLQIWLMLWSSMAYQNSIYDWARDHRVHHKGSDTNADPHNANRGFFFAHMGWLLVRKHPDVFRESRKINNADLDTDPIVQFQKKHYIVVGMTMCYVVPALLGYHLIDSAWEGFWIGGVFRHVWLLHMTWCVNSVAHFYGSKPYDPKIRPVENLLVSIGAVGEGWHNFHHRYPTDYATSEFGIGQWNPTKVFIDCMAAIGQAYDLKRSSTAAARREFVAAQEHRHD
ncbi:unnamed protein product [Aphanomyces euteiches]|uniref:Fatty acid desaturase domain-containing protein n=1 Tax=Aphanomyces euteiches TaxID=100861 RepID=A0A6G0W5V4_9STRA|nr:hypothetical protein Ae201684_018447 [Aphanomyces euteiches]KAH9075953.1 hypothetical protein Ae201684P_012443 [Aphanomyces euteiches]KAH9137961.1 hypothetical protein AeRB84_017579 [Aphanomyces euteiches]